MNLEVRFGGVVLYVEVVDADSGWEALRQIAEKQASGHQQQQPAIGAVGVDVVRPPRGKSKAAALREMARRILADGKAHERREIANAARAAGLDSRYVVSALRCPEFEKSVNAAGRPTYRIRKAPTVVPDAAKPAYMRDHPPAALGEIAKLGALRGNGAERDG
jgi:hypothetical protein